MNQFVLEAQIAEARALRFTPAGLPALDLQLEHVSQQDEAGQPREVKLALRAVAFGAAAETLVRQPVGSAWRFHGFLATPRTARHPVLHIQAFQPQSTP